MSNNNKKQIWVIEFVSRRGHTKEVWDYEETNNEQEYNALVSRASNYRMANKWGSFKMVLKERK